MENIYTENMADFGSRERKMAAKLLAAELPREFSNSGVRLAMNKSSGFVFLTNDDYQVAMMNGNKLAIFHTTPYEGHEGFIEDLLNEHSPDDLNGEDVRYLREAAENEGVDLPEAWQEEE
jgi:PAS domain-containing protein